MRDVLAMGALEANKPVHTVRIDVAVTLTLAARLLGCASVKSTIVQHWDRGEMCVGNMMAKVGRKPRRRIRRYLCR